MEKKCIKCNILFKKPNNLAEYFWSKRIYCSRKCHNQELRGGSLEISCPICLKIFRRKKSMINRCKTQNCCSRECSNSLQNKIYIGEKSKNWKGGISPINKKIRDSEDYNTWRKSVYKRDNWTCQKCFVKQKHPIAHHIKTFNDYPELRFEIDNGITLCMSCHKKIHSEIGLKTRFKSFTDTYKIVLTRA